ncbi:MAG: hypothetical protein LRY51_01650 [Geovibrio sp.]|nr:hypothetical protein [Geovibrio sp.]
MKKVFAPGCALLIHNPELAEKIAAYLSEKHGITERHSPLLSLPPCL